MAVTNTENLPKNIKITTDIATCMMAMHRGLNTIIHDELMHIIMLSTSYILYARSKIAL